MIKVKVLINCTGSGYKKLKAGKVIELKTEVAEKLALFGYVRILEKTTDLGEKEQDEKELLLERAKELKIKGANENWHIDTLKEKIEETEKALED